MSSPPAQGFILIWQVAFTRDFLFFEILQY